MIILIKKFFIYLRNILVWLAPFLLFCAALSAVVFFLRGGLDNYIKLLEVLVWPVTLLIGLFFFRKVVTFMFFSMDEFNFFGAKGELKNVNQIIDEEVDKKFTRMREEEIRKVEEDKLKAQFNNSSATAEENEKLARDMYKLYEDYKKFAEEEIQKLNSEIKNVRDNSSQVSSQENTTPGGLEGQITSNLGAGEMIVDAVGDGQKI